MLCTFHSEVAAFLEANEVSFAKKEDTLRAKHVQHSPNLEVMGARTLLKQNVWKENWTALSEELADRARRKGRDVEVVAVRTPGAHAM